MTTYTAEEITTLESRLTPAERCEIDRLVAGALPLREYIRGAWPIMEPGTPLVWGWHIDAISDFLEAVCNGEIRKLIVNEPPRHGKSNLIMVCWPTWIWTFRPELKFLGASYSHDLSKRDAVKSRRLINSQWYQKRWGHMFKFTGDQNEKMRYDNDKAGYRIATSVGGMATGEGGDIRALDDPHKPDEVQSDVVRTSDIEWIRETWSSRVTDPKTSAEVLVMQRLHGGDATAYMMAEVGGYVHLRLPGRYESEHKCRVQVGTFSWEDPREVEGEPLWPEQWGTPELDELEKSLGSYGTAGQIQQRPSPAGGGIIKKHWFRFYRRGEELRAYEETIQSWDFAFKKTAESSHVAGQVWSRQGARVYLRYRMLERLSFTESLTAVRRVSLMYPEADAKLVEDKANGPALMDVLQDEIPGIVPVDVEGDKVARMHAVSPFIEAGNVWLPHPEDAPWVENFVELICSFPNGASNDDGDALSQALRRLMHRAPLGLDAVSELVGDASKAAPGIG